MQIWSFINSKGGVGKSTLTINIAHYLMQRQFKVCIIDADDQGTVRDWQDANSHHSFIVVGLDTRESLKNLKHVVNREQFDFCLIDTPGRFIEIQAVAIALSHKIFIPTGATCADIWASNNVVQLIKARQEALIGVKGCPLAAFILNNVKKKTKIARDSKKLLQEFRIPIMDQMIHGCVAYAENVSVFDSDKENAKNEIANLANQLLDFDGDCHAN